DESSLLLLMIRDIVRNYFQQPWFDLNEQDEQLIREFFQLSNSDKQISSEQKSSNRRSLLVQLANIDDNHQHQQRHEPKFEIISLDDIIRHHHHHHRRHRNVTNSKQQQQQQQSTTNELVNGQQSILFIRSNDVNHRGGQNDDNQINQQQQSSSSLSSYHRSTVQIRLVTDDEAIKHLSEILRTCPITNDEIIAAYNQLERFIDRDKVLQNLLDERTEFLRKLSEWSETLLEYPTQSSSSDLDGNLSSQSSDDDDDGEIEEDDDDEEKQERQIGRELNQMAMKIITLKQRQQLLSNIVANIPLMFRDVNDLNMYRINMTETSQMLDSESIQLFHRWTTNISKNIHYDLTKQCIIIDQRTQRPRITLSPYLEKFAQNIRQLRQYHFIIPDDIDRMESNISLYIDFVSDLRKIIRFYMTVAEQILPSQRPMLIDKARSFTTLLESNQQLTWSHGIDSISKWINELKKFMLEFQQQNKQLQQLHLKILETIKWMIDISLTQWDRFIEKIRLIIGEVSSTSTNQSYQNTYVWRKHWDYQLYKILEYYFNQSMMIRINNRRQTNKQSAIMNRMKTAKQLNRSATTTNNDKDDEEMIIMFNNVDQDLLQWERMNLQISNQDNIIELQFHSSGFVVYEPSFEKLKQLLFERFQRFIRYPSTFRAFVDWSLDTKINPSLSSIDNSTQANKNIVKTPRTLFHNIYYRNATKFQNIYHKVFDAIDELIRIRQQFIQWTAIYNVIRMIKSNNYVHHHHNVDDNDNEKQSSTTTTTKKSTIFNCKTLEDYQYNLRLIKNLSKKFSNKYSMINEIQCDYSNFIINIIPIKMFIEWLFNESEIVLLHSIRDQCHLDLNQIEQICRQNIDQLKHCPTNIDELIEFDQIITKQLDKIHSKLTIDTVTLREKIHFFRTWSSSSTTAINNQSLDLINRFDQLKLIINEFDNIFNNRMELLTDYREQLQTKISIELNRLQEEIDNFLQRWIELSDNIKQTPEIINDFQINSNQLIGKMKELSKSCEYFQLEQPRSFESMNKINNEIQELYEKFHIIYEFEKGLQQYQEMEWIVCRNKLSKINQYINDWLEQHHPTTLSNDHNDGYLQSYIERWKKFLQTIEICRGDNYQSLHWNQFLRNILNLTDINYENLKLSDLWSKQEKLLENRSEILDINKRAYNDNLLRDALNDLNQFALNGQFILYPYRMKNNIEIMLIKDWYQCFNQISDCFLLIQTIRNMDNDEISDEYLQQYQEWETKLVQFEQLVLLLNSIQRKWISLEPIYNDHHHGSSSSSTLSSSFFHDLTFVRYSNDFQELMKLIRQNNGRFSYLIQVKNWENRLRIIDQNFQQTQKKLRSFIEESRQRFPRFYFLADEDLLLILSGKIDLNQSGLVKKLFINTIGCLVYHPNDQQQIIAIESIQGERIQLKKSIQIDNNHGPSCIERWLQDLDLEIKSTLKSIFLEKLSQKHFVYNDNELFTIIPSQILSLYCYLDFTESIENAIDNNKLVDLKNYYEQILSTLTKDVDQFQQKIIELLSKNYSESSSSTATANQINQNLSKIKIKQIVLDIIHYINVIETLIDSNVNDRKHWCWQSQLRFYTNQSSSTAEIKICMGLAEFDYSFEYLGCLGDSKLVYTTLTNKCFLTLTQAMDLGLGGNPYGPAGTGKTESVKALGQYFGRQVLVFNCDEAIDVKSMTRIIVGLIKCGNWGCFDEFNRLQLDVLSVLSSQIQEIQWAIKNQSKTVNLNEYGTININNNAAIFITLNPAGKDYGGRNRIPDNLKSLFLPVAMTIPEIKTIVRFLSLAEGFSDQATRILGEKIPCWFEFAQGSMSQQKHYDWGLRTIKACLESSGRRLNNNRKIMLNNDHQSLDECQLEIQLVIDTLRQQIKSKLVDTDSLKFDGLIEAVFGLEFGNNNNNTNDNNQQQQQRSIMKINSQSNSDSFVDIVENCFNENNLINNEYQLEKIQQLYEQIQIRFGVVLIGPSGSGKTTIWQMLKRSLEQMSSSTTTATNKFRSINLIIINPKSMQRSSLFGYIDDDTREWHDGLFSAKSRDITRNDNDINGDDSNNSMNWIIFDGDIDPDWVEALNSVLDDNRVLTLPSGERIDFDLNHCRILFETTSLKNASPATISRLGVVSIDMIMINEMVQCFVAKNQLSFTAISIIQNYLNQNHQQLFSPISTARSMLEHFRYCQLNHEDESNAIDRISGHYFSQQQQQQSTNNDYEINQNNLIITDSIKRYQEMLKPLIGQHILLIGPIGSGKTILAQELLFQSMNGQLLSIDCTPTTDSKLLLKQLFDCTTIVHSGTNRMIRSKINGQQIWLFIRHLELLTYDKWSSNSLISLLTLLLKHNGFHHPDTFEWIQIDPTFQLILTCTDIHLIDKRLLTQLHLIQLQRYSLNEIQQDFLKIGIDIIDSLRHYDNHDEQSVQYEIYRTLMNNLTEESNRQILKTMMDHNDNQIFYTSINGQSKYRLINNEQFCLQIQKWIRNYCQENDLNRPEWPQLKQTKLLIADLCSFLAIDNNNNNEKITIINNQNQSDSLSSLINPISIMIILGNNGMGRKFLIKTIAHNFGYDKIWTPDSIQSERHLNNELQTLFNYDDQSTTTTTTTADDNRKLLLLLIDEIHFEILPYLRDQIYTKINIYNQQQQQQSQQQQQISNITIRLIITTTGLTSMDHLMWLRKARIHRSLPFTSDDYYHLTKGLIYSQIDKQKLFVDDDDDSIIKMFPKIYQHFQQQDQSNTNNMDNIRSYTDFIQNFIQLFHYQQQQTDDENKRMKLGVARLDQVSNQVKILKNDAYEQKKLLDSKRTEADDAFQMIMNSMHQSEDKKIELEDVQQRMKIETDNLKERKLKIDEELNEIEPILQSAKAAIGGIRSDSLSEIRSLRAPPEIIRDILEGVLRLMGVNDTSWVSMKTFLSKRGVKEDIMNFDCHKITPEIRQKVEQLLKKRSESFQLTTAKRASAAAAPLAEWVKANVEYSSVLHKIEPLERELKKLETNLHRAQSRIRTLDSQLNDVDTEVDKLRERMQAVTIEAAEIEINLKKSAKILEQSETIVNDLSDEYQRWNEKLLQIEIEYRRMPLKCMIIAAYLTQACRESSYSRRTEILSECFEKFQINSFNLIEFLQFETEEELLLFGQTLSSSSSHKALNLFKNVEITNFNAKDWLKILELGIRFGRTIIITDFNQFDQRLIPLIMGLIYGSSNDQRYWTYIVSSLTLANIRVVNLSPSFSSISTKLLGQIIDVKKPELETEKIRIDNYVRDLQKQLKQFENELLIKLSSIDETGNILENQPLIEQLKFLKKSTAQIEISLKESDHLKSELERERIQYKNLSQFAANLYFSIENLSKLCPMYYFGYEEFEQLFIDSLRSKSENDIFTEDDLCFAFYNYISRALFNEHRRTFRQYLKNCFPKQSTLIISWDNDTNQQNIDEFLMEIFQSNTTCFGGKIALIITVPGSDPNTEIKNSMEKFGYDLQMISMGNETIDQVSLLIQNMIQTSGGGNRQQQQQQPMKSFSTKQQQQQQSKPIKVLCLNNLHLVIGWLTKLIQILQSSSSSSNNSRMLMLPPLILVTESNEQFPRTLLEMCIKYAHESAPGLRSHLRRLRSQQSQQQQQRSTTTNNKIKPDNNSYGKLLENFEYFHAICCERRFYIPFGWNKNYEFSFNEFYFGCEIIEKILDFDRLLDQRQQQQKSVKNNQQQQQRYKIYQYLDGLFHQVIYGGKIDFNIDELVLKLLLKRCFHPNSDFQQYLSKNSNQQKDQQDSDFRMLGLPLNANEFRNRLLDKRLKQNLQLLSISKQQQQQQQNQQQQQELQQQPSSPSSSSSAATSTTTSTAETKTKTTTLNPSGIKYFRKIWIRILGKCRIDQIDDLREEMSNNSIVESSFLDASTLNLFIRGFILFEFDFAKRLILQIDHELQTNESINNNNNNKDLDHYLQINHTPDSWLNVWLNGSEIAQDFLINLAKIYMKLSNIINTNDNSSISFDMTHCFHPKLFLNSLKQFVAKKLSTSIDRLFIDYQWTTTTNDHNDQQQQNESTIIKIRLDGIWIEAAEFFDQQLQECSSDSKFQNLMPPLMMIFSTKSDQQQQSNDQNSIQIPLYSCSKRQTLLEQWPLPCSTTKQPTTKQSTSNERWIEMGVALVLGNFI
uniref:Dynein heavy chain, cytoplasmic n=1 Tax=Dermatophagoides pteronyssinus TaxID=6956 RepID=A0A6P6XQE3_DERPT